MTTIEIVKQSHKILAINGSDLTTIEQAARVCYKSQDKTTVDSAPRLVKGLVKNGHHAMLEFGDMTVQFTTNRGVTHELVRHRLCSFAQESTRYVKCDHPRFIKPVWMSDNCLGEHSSGIPRRTVQERGSGIPWRPGTIWVRSVFESANAYQQLIAQGWVPQKAREVLPNSLLTEIIVKANFREWMHIFKLRCSSKAHAQIRELMTELRDACRTIVPIVFDKEV